MAGIKFIYKYIIRKAIYHLSSLYEHSADLYLGKDFAREKKITGYKASKRYEVDFVLKNINTNGKIFLDVGSGKGSVLHLTQKYNFLNIYGVEHDLEMYNTSLDNLKEFNCERTKIFFMNLQNLPEDIFDSVDIFYLFNPFDANLIERFVDRLMQSKHRQPRHIDIIYTNPVHKDKFTSAKNINLNKNYNFLVSNSPTHHYIL